MSKTRTFPAPGLLFCLALAVFSPRAHTQDDLVWNALDPENTVYLETADGTAVILLNPSFAPRTVAQFRHLLEEQFYRGLSFYRVIEGFVAQGGDESDIDGKHTAPLLPREFEIDWPQKPDDDEAAENWQPMAWTEVQRDDPFAPYTGFIDGFPAGRDSKKDGKAWLTHCPGAVAMARNEDPDTGSTDFYIVIGQAPRYLDRNLTVFGRVVWGMDVVQRIKRGSSLENGMIEADLDRTWIKRMRLASSLPEAERLDLYMVDTNSRGFVKMLDDRRNRREKFFHHKPPRFLDVCQVPVLTRLEKTPVTRPQD